MVFRDASIRRIVISPTGEWIVALIVHRGKVGISAQRRGDAVTYPIHVSRYPVIGMDWIGEDDLLLTLGDVGRLPERTATLLRFRRDGRVVVADALRINRPGRLANVLLSDPDAVLWSKAGRRLSTVSRVPTSVLYDSPETNDDDSGTVVQVADVRGWADQWVTDGNGTVRAYRTMEWDDGPRFTVGYRANGASAWREIWSGRDDDPDGLLPVGVTADGKRLIVVAHAGRDTQGLHEFDPETGAFTTALFTDPDVDASDAILDQSGTEVIAVAYMKAGKVEYDYLGDYAKKHLGGLESRVQGESLRVVSSSLDRRYFVLLTMGATNPGVFYYYAKGSGTWARLADVVSGVTPDLLVPMRSIHATSSDGTRVEGFLTLPTRPGDVAPRPLVVMPHGGPIGVADGGFDPLVQYTALAGFAVLQVNYRGSSGYGREFYRAGFRAPGEAIEDDIDAVVQAVIDEGHVDPDRMCIAGGSYGGYSALMSAIRFPHRYRCVVTIAGVSDVALKFHGSDWSMWKTSRDAAVEIYGDPEADFEHMVEISPVYRVREIRVPVLIAHGSRDERVDPEHAYRLRAMLAAYGKPYQWLLVEGGEHTPTRAEWVRYASTMKAFLRQHLGPTRPHRAAH